MNLKFKALWSYAWQPFFKAYKALQHFHAWRNAYEKETTYQSAKFLISASKTNQKFFFTSLMPNITNKFAQNRVYAKLKCSVNYFKNDFSLFLFFCCWFENSSPCWARIFDSERTRIEWFRTETQWNWYFHKQKLWKHPEVSKTLKYCFFEQQNIEIW